LRPSTKRCSNGRYRYENQIIFFRDFSDRTFSHPFRKVVALSVLLSMLLVTPFVHAEDNDESSAAEDQEAQDTRSLYQRAGKAAAAASQGAANKWDNVKKNINEIKNFNKNAQERAFDGLNKAADQNEE
jgi:hypothetical protein